MPSPGRTRRFMERIPETAEAAIIAYSNAKKRAARGRPFDSVRRSLFRRRQCGSFLELGRSFGCILLAFLENERVALGGDFPQAVHHRTRTSRDQTAHDDVLLESVERVGLAVDGSLGEHARGLLERCRRDERTRLQAGLGDAEQNRMTGCALLALSFHASVDLVELDLVDLLALQQLGIAGVVDLDFLQHLANDHLDVLVVDVDALQPIDLLNFIHEVGCQFFDALDCENVVRGWIALDDIVALLDHVAVLKMNVLALRDQVLLRLLAFGPRFDRDTALVLVVFTEPHRTADLGDDRSFLRTARFEQFRHSRQTTGDVACLGAFGRDTRNNVTGLHVATRIDRDNGIDRKLISGLPAAGELENLVARLDYNGRT